MQNLFKYFVIPILLFFAVIAFVFWVLLPIWESAQYALELKKANADNLIQRKQLTASLEKLIGQYGERTADFNYFSKAIPTGQDIPSLLVNLEALASENSIVFSGVNFKPKDLNTPGVKILMMEIKVKGSYPAFQNYIRAMEKSLRLFDVVSVSFGGIAPGQTGANANNLEFNLIVNTYYQ
ncbi:MAG: type 4a pilus biogenesis protein PilO [Candidatus Azambacteria bacterium]|nr:type 4a pilus biogenesis protein PilO [Candidatus Azambacteria bacterium]